MPEQIDIDGQLNLLNTYRRTLWHYLKQQAQFSALYAPPYLAIGIEDTREHIRRIKGNLRAWHISVADYPDDNAPIDAINRDDQTTYLLDREILADQAVQDVPADAVEQAQPDARKLPVNSGGRLLELPDYANYYPPTATQAIIKAILERPGYHLIEASAGMGKTALIGYLWKKQVPVRPAVIQLFSRDYHYVSIQKALYALQEQYLAILARHSQQRPQSNDTATSLENLIQLASEQGLRSLILIDGIDEADRGELSSLITTIIPDLSIYDPFKMTTMVITTQSSTDRNALSLLPVHHSLYHALKDTPSHILAHFTFEDIKAFLTEELKISDSDIIAACMFDLSQGYPLFVHDLRDAAKSYSSNPNIFAELPPTPTMDRYWAHKLDEIEKALTNSDKPARKIIPLTVAAKSGLRFEDIATLLELEHDMLGSVLDRLSLYFSKQEDEYILVNKHFRTYVSHDERYRSEVLAYTKLLIDWNYRYTHANTLGDIPPYVLRHAAEYLADTPDLRLFFTRHEWFGELEQRTHSRRACKDAVLRAWSAAERAMEQAESDQALNRQAVNIILCALMQASFTASLLPELILKVVELRFWKRSEALDYADFCDEADRATVIAGLDAPQSRAQVPTAYRAANAVIELELISKLKGTARGKQFRDWLRKWEQLGVDETQRLDTQNLARQILATLDQPVEPIHEAAQSDFQALYERLQQYMPPPTGEISDEYFDILTSLQSAWQQVPSPIAQSYLPLIVRSIARASRANLLGALDVLAPALITLFPGAIPEIRLAIESLIRAYP